MKTDIYFKRYIKNDPKQIKAFYLFVTGSKYWFLNGCYHREDGPAIEFWDGNKEWYLNGFVYSKKEHKNKLSNQCQ